MDYQDYVERLRHVAQGIERDSRFRPVIDIERSFEPSEFEDLQSSLNKVGLANVAVWDEFRKFHGAANGFLFQWRYEGDEGVAITTGSANIAMVFQIYLPEYLSRQKVIPFYDQRRILDRISPDDQVDVRFEEGTERPELLYFADETGTFHPLRLGFPEYLETLLEARAMYGWQRFFVDIPDFPMTREYADKFRHSLATLFPTANTALFRAPGE